MSSSPSAPLELSSLESGASMPAAADFPVAELFAELQQEFAASASAKGLEFQVDAAAEYAYSDRALVAQILRSLLTNAVQYTRAGRVQLQCAREQPAIRIDVVDTGIGIGAEQISAMFAGAGPVPPAQGSNAADGAALGTVKRLVKLLNLRLDVTSEPGRGSAFSLRLPRGRAPAGAAASAVARHRDGHAARVLLVEDDAPVRESTRMLLKLEGYRVSAVANLAEALRHAREEGAPDLLLTDYHLRDGETGLQVIAALRARLGVAVKAVVITGDVAALSAEAAADPRLRIAGKPVTAEELLGVMKRLLGG